MRAVLIVVNQDGGTTSLATTQPKQPLASPVLAVKIDNAPAARPQTGLGSASVGYVEPVEGGLTRLVTIYSGTPPEVVGPVRSAPADRPRTAGPVRHAGPRLPRCRAGAAARAARGGAGQRLARGGGLGVPPKPGPTRAHNLYLRPARLPGGAVGPEAAPLRFGPSPTAGTPAASYGAAGFAVTWSSADHRWLLSMDGTPLVTDTGRVRAATVVWQHVDVTTDRPRLGAAAGYRAGVGAAHA